MTPYVAIGEHAELDSPVYGTLADLQACQPRVEILYSQYCNQSLTTDSSCAEYTLSSQVLIDQWFMLGTVCA